MLDLYNHYKFYHFFSICFGLGCGLCSYRPYYSLVMPVVLTVFCMFVFEAVGWCFGLPPHTRRCRGPPFHRRDALWGFVFALIVAVLHLHSYHVYTLSHGSGIAVFAIRGAIRRCRALWKHRNKGYTYFTATNGQRGHASFTGTDGQRGHTFFTGTNGQRSHTFFTGTNGQRGHTFFTGTPQNRGHASFTGTNGQRGHTFFTGTNWNSGHTSFTGTPRNRGHAYSTGTD
ncbi:uncharacterized protein LOC128625370 isoform X1 [Ictalurus furcatus]|uniref:uncharacterized protein LOC128625370 isoform X1 n=1 Tax=Ictalurus furcatus TaxID=66913 RepID=UPI00235011FB|nr:uncharacterized protein LOC128625370 isoform X1 [Ictalurus furcatus]